MNTDQRLSVLSPSLEQSLSLGRKFATLLQLGDVVEFVGDLGGGKTTLIKGIAAGLGIDKTVTSPTYNIQRSYKLPTGGTLEHYDLYRLGDDEILHEEISEIISAGETIICVEWADHFSEHLKADRFVVEAHYIDENTRRYNISGMGDSAQKRLAAAKKELESVK